MCSARQARTSGTQGQRGYELPLVPPGPRNIRSESSRISSYEGYRDVISAFSVLRVRLFLLVLLVAVPAIGLILYNAWEDRRDAEGDVRDNALHLTQLAVSQQEQVIEGTRELLVALAVDVTERDVAGCNAHFAAVLA